MRISDWSSDVCSSDLLAAVEQDKLTLRETALRFGKPMDSFEGSPEEVADQLQDWFESGAVDGFLLGESLPGQFEVFVRSEERRVGKEGVSTCRSGWSLFNKQKKSNTIQKTDYR